MFELLLYFVLGIYFRKVCIYVIYLAGFLIDGS